MDTRAPFSRALLHTVAKLHYEQDVSQRDIAQQLNLSTATVSRLIKRARDEGIVRIEVTELIEPDALAERLRDALGLDRVAIAQSAPEPGTMAALADPVARLLRETDLGPGSVLGVGWGRTVWEVIKVGLPHLPGTTVVPLSGGIPEAAQQFQTGEIARLAASQIGGNPKFVHAPYLLAEATKRALVADPALRDSFDLWNRVDVALLGIGNAAITPPDPALDHAAGDVLLRYFDVNGQIVHWDNETSLLAISTEQLLRTPVKIGLAASPSKAVSIVGAARSRIINALATDTRTAMKILELA
jgi:DNA-binding transcriptional regulator LsrR (DeoR family)